MAFGRPTRPRLPRAPEVSGKYVVALALVLATVLYLFAGPLRAQWVNEPPSIDPFAQVIHEPDHAAAAPANESVLPPPSAPAITGPSGQVLAPSGLYPPAPPYNPPVAGPPLVAAPGPQFQDAMQSQQAAPAISPIAPPTGNIPPEDQSVPPAGTNSVYRLLDHLEVNFVARGYYSNDQRIEWSGMETTFGAEGVIAPRLRQRCGDFEFLVDSEFYINQPYDRDQLLTDPERKSYAANFQVNEFDISQLALVTTYQDWTFKAGKFVTPFGRTYFPLYTNAQWDAPFIRTEVIDWRETGILAHYKSGYFVGDIALTNGGENLATNSGKSAVARVGLESDGWAVGCSAKQGAGVGSENEKEFDNYFGVDMMFREGPFQLSSECVFDEYGFGRPSFNPLNITWVKSIYYRDVSSGQQGVPCTGIGYYVNLGYAEGPWNTVLNYGDFYPLYTGTAPNQRVQHRGLGKVAYQLAKPLQIYSVLILENGGYLAQENERRIPVAVLEGCQFTF